jgi:peroxiredoxin Q/BCP
VIPEQRILEPTMTENTPVRLAPGDAAPPLDLTDDTGAVHTWKKHRGQRVVLYVYPSAMTPGCTTQACDFRDSLDALNAAGITVLGLSPDKRERLSKFRERDGLTFPLLSDPAKSVLTAYGAFGEKQLYGKTVVGVIRSTFVVDVDTKGNAVIERAMYAVKATGHVAKLRRELGV